jgi:tetratricopeptide (TPR) repeat protein
VRRRVYETAEANPHVMQWVVGQIDEAREPDTVFKELAEGEGDAAERVFARSFNLPQLGEDGRAALLALSLFVPSASREALAAVAGFGDERKRLDEAVKNLHALWLIKGIDQNRRLAVEGLTRRLAGARLSKDERAEEFRRRYVAHSLGYAEAHAQQKPEDYDLLEAEKDNLLSATETAFAHEDWWSVMRMAYALARPVDGMLYVRGYWDEALRVGDLALKAARSSQNEEAIAVMAHNVAVMYENRGELDAARWLYGESLEIEKKLGNQMGIARTTSQLGIVHYFLGEIAESKAKHEESLKIRRKIGDQRGIAIDLHQLAILAQNQGELDEAQRLYGESLEIKKRLGNQYGVAVTLHQLGNIAYLQGGLGEARRLYNEGLEINKRLGNQSGIAITLYQLGRLAEDTGDKAEAARLFREALTIFEKLHSPYADLARRSLKRVEGESS